MATNISGDTGVSQVQEGSITASDLVQTVADGVAKPMQIMRLAAKATTSGTAIDFSPADGTGIPSWAKKVTVLLAGVSTNSTTDIQLVLGTGSGLETSGYLGSTTALTASAVGTGVLLSTGITLDGATAAANIYHGCVELTLSSDNTWVFTGGVGQSNGTRTTQVRGSKVLGGALTQIRLTAGGVTTFDAGSVSLLIEG